MKLSSYLNENEQRWNDVESANIQKMMSYLKKNVDVNLCEMAKSDDALKVFKSLEGWLFNFYHKAFRDGLAYIGYNYQEYQKELIYAFILSVTRDRSNVNVLYDMLISKEIITKMLVYEDIEYKIMTKDFGNLSFMKANNVVDRETRKYLEKLGEKVVDGCHEISFFLIENDPSLKAVTSICTKGLGHNYYHSFVLNEDDEVIDLTANLIMPKGQYYLLNNVQELSVANYKEYLSEGNNSEGFDESKTLYGLLRNALYKQFLTENKTD